LPSVFRLGQFFGGETRLVVAGSGHIAGVINPPAKNKRNYWTATSQGRLDPDPQAWFATAESVPGSWWPAWIEWLAPHSGPQVEAPAQPGNAEFHPIEDAPGRYVKEKAP
jgi:polyhydroxyalkanoate synthase